MLIAGLSECLFQQGGFLVLLLDRFTHFQSLLFLPGEELLVVLERPGGSNVLTGRPRPGLAHRGRRCCPVGRF